MAQVQKNGEFKCHWGPEEVYTCWKEGFDKTSKLKECGCYGNDVFLNIDCTYNPLSISDCLNKIDREGNYSCHWGPGEMGDCFA